MKNFVITSGKDCDGYSKPEITKYVTEELAEKCAQHSAEGSDGIQYWAVDEKTAKEYAEQCGLTLPDYSFDENFEIIED